MPPLTASLRPLLGKTRHRNVVKLDGIAGQRLRAPSTTALSLEGPTVEFIIGGWFRLNSRPAAACRCIYKGDGTNANADYALYWNNADDKWTFQVFSFNPSTGVYSNAVARAPVSNTVLGQWIHLAGLYDKTANLIRIFCNGVEVISGNPSAGGAALVTGRTAHLGIGAAGSAANTVVSGALSIGPSFFAKPPTSALSLAPAMLASLYNSGVPKNYGELTNAEKTSWGLKSYWDMDESAGTRYDRHSTNHLAENNSIAVKSAGF